MSDCTPAAGRAFLTPLYDRAIALTMREEHFRSSLLAQVLRGEPRHVLDVGCGTGTFALRLAAAAPYAEVVGVDPDPDVLGRARRKDSGSRVRWVKGSAAPLDFPDASFDRVTASLVLHHLTTDAKRAALEEARRVLAPAGRLHVADWGRPQGLATRAGFLALRALDGFEPTRLHAAGMLPATIEAAGFHPVQLRARLRTAWGTLELLEARRR